jgi:putative N6-adenine-specific DNA methylase
MFQFSTTTQGGSLFLRKASGTFLVAVFTFLSAVQLSTSFSFSAAPTPRFTAPVSQVSLSQSFESNYESQSYDSSQYYKPPQSLGRCYFATCIPGLENSLAQELESIGAYDVQVAKSGVHFSEPPSVAKKSGSQAQGANTSEQDVDPDIDPLTGTTYSMEVGLKAVLWVRTAHRVMERISCSVDDNYVITTKDELYDFVKKSCDVRELLGDGKGGMLSLAVKVTLGGRAPRELCHTHFTALTVKNALVDACRDLRGDGLRPDVDTDNPHVPLVVALKGENEGKTVSASIYRCLNGLDSMHRRGYRGGTAIHKAAMKESMAAGLLYEAGWDKLVTHSKENSLSAVLCDPMMGSGTFGIEAALMAADVAPGLTRMRLIKTLPPVLRWKSCNTDVWKNLCREAQQREQKGRQWLVGFSSNDNKGSGGERKQRNCVILGNEMNPQAYELAINGMKQAGVMDCMSLSQRDCESWNVASQLVEGRTIAVVNPPWGVRLEEDMEESWVSLRTFLRQECVGVEAWVLSGNKDATRILKMKKSRSVPLNTAAEKLRWLQYHVFAKPEPRPSNDNDSENEESSNDNEEDTASTSSSSSHAQAPPQADEDPDSYVMQPQIPRVFRR